MFIVSTKRQHERLKKEWKSLLDGPKSPHPVRHISNPALRPSNQKMSSHNLPDSNSAPIVNEDDHGEPPSNRRPSQIVRGFTERLGITRRRNSASMDEQSTPKAANPEQSTSARAAHIQATPQPLNAHNHLLQPPQERSRHKYPTILRRCMTKAEDTMYMGGVDRLRIQLTDLSPHVRPEYNHFLAEAIVSEQHYRTFHVDWVSDLYLELQRNMDVLYKDLSKKIENSRCRCRGGSTEQAAIPSETRADFGSGPGPGSEPGLSTEPHLNTALDNGADLRTETETASRIPTIRSQSPKSPLQKARRDHLERRSLEKRSERRKRCPQRIRPKAKRNRVMILWMGTGSEKGYAGRRSVQKERLVVSRSIGL